MHAGLRRRLFLATAGALGLGLAAHGAACTREPAPAPPSAATGDDSRTLRVWWAQGFLPEENEAILTILDRWKRAENREADVRFMPVNEMDAELLRALDEGKPPDLFHSTVGDMRIIPILAWRNQLADVSDLIEPRKHEFIPTAIEASYLKNKVTKQRGCYAVPFGQQLSYIHYWRDQLAIAGLGDQPIPTGWSEYWQFWKAAQDRLRAQGREGVYGLGLSVSPMDVDSFNTFEQFLEAYGARIVSPDGALLLDAPGTRDKIVAVLREYAGFFNDGYVPKDAVEWTSAGNNIGFLEGRLLMTTNGSLSIPLTQKLDPNEYNLGARELYYDKMVTAGWPDRPGGGPLRMIVGIKQIVTFERSRNKEAAKSFLRFLLSPENMNLLLRDGGKGRYLPVTTRLLEDPYWSDPGDPHLSAALRMALGPTRPGYEAYSAAYTEVQFQNVWAKALLSVLQNKASPENAADWAIAHIKDTFEKWD
ncbi:ABC transporter substrate-binding protein [Sorangium sp. So ce1335]|uniref:ABC transporter substrate-binding protein n=1 Tax=Sorangium sp. So ce1335 TaxID=3133335 RepID=UPI003F5DE545